jgi:flagellar motility protein MotE (MotC chaperone)
VPFGAEPNPPAARIEASQSGSSEADMNRALFHSTLFGMLAALAIVSLPSAGFCLESKKPEPAAKPGEPKNPVSPPAADSKPQMTEIQRFCTNNVAAAGDARAAWQAAKLIELEDEIKKRITELDVKRAEYQEWMKKRDDAMKKAEEGVVAIYSRMRPDAAALQLAAMEDAMAAALLAKLPPRTASAILNEIEPGRAARLANTMVGSRMSPDGKKS